jgi:alpha-acetolactate decarboxylase
MKHYGFLFALALLANSAAGSEVGSSYSNVAVLVAETGASSSWATKEILTAEQNAQKLEKTMDAANEKLALKLEARFNRMLEASVQN